MSVYENLNPSTNNDNKEHALRNSSTLTTSIEGIYFTNTPAPNNSSHQSYVNKTSPEYANVNPDDNGDGLEYVQPNLDSHTLSKDGLYFTNAIDKSKTASSEKGDIRRKIFQTKNFNPDENDEYVLPNLHNQHNTSDGMFSAKTNGKTSKASSQKTPMVVERTRSGIYNIAGQDENAIYDLSSASPNVNNEEPTSSECYFQVAQYRVQILLGVAILLIIFGVLLGFTVGQSNSPTVINTTAAGKI